MKEDATPSGLSRMEFDTQGSRGGNPGLEVATASRYLYERSLMLVQGFLRHIGDVEQDHRSSPPLSLGVNANRCRLQQSGRHSRSNAVKFIETLKLAIAAIWAHKLRSALTLPGMIIGAMAVVVVYSL